MASRVRDLFDRSHIQRDDNDEGFEGYRRLPLKNVDAVDTIGQVVQLGKQRLQDGINLDRLV